MGTPIPARGGLLLVALLLACCCPPPLVPANGIAANGAPASGTSADGTSADGAPAAASLDGRLARRSGGRPNLMLLVVIDQLPSWALARYLPHLPEQGLLRRAATQGAYFERVRYGYASTFTAPGHAAIVSGAPPAVSGIPGNSRYDRAAGRKRETVADPQHPTFGYGGGPHAGGGHRRGRHAPHRHGSGEEPVGASPRVLRVATVGDRLVEASAGKSQVVALSIKDRAAVLSGGRKAQLAVWFDARAGGFTTSRYYAQELPGWLVDFRRRHPPAALLQPWTPLDPARLQRMAPQDDGAGEGDWLGFGATFPHHPGKGDKPHKLVKLAPALGEQLVVLAGEAATQLGLGRDEHADLLVVSMSGTDYAGHTFGAESQEYADHLIRADVALGRLYDALRTQLQVDVLITADHGVAPLPEQNQAGGGRLYPKEIKAAVRQAGIDAGVDKPLAGLARPFIYLSAPDHEGLRAAAIKRLTAHRGVRRVYDTRQVQALRSSAEPLDRAVGLSIVDGMTGDLYLVLEPGWFVDEDRPRGAGTGHGSPWPYDRVVPVLMLGDGVPVVRERAVVAQPRVATTLAAFLGVQGGSWSGEPLVVPTGRRRPTAAVEEAPR